MLCQTCISPLDMFLTEPITVQRIMDKGSVFFDIPKNVIVSKSRKSETVEARQILMFFFGKYTKLNLRAIGKHFGGRDHSTVIHSIKIVNNYIQTERNYKAMINKFDQFLNSDDETM